MPASEEPQLRRSELETGFAIADESNEGPLTQDAEEMIVSRDSMNRRLSVFSGL